jgi:hypothetical protein
MKQELLLILNNIVPSTVTTSTGEKRTSCNDFKKSFYQTNIAILMHTHNNRDEMYVKKNMMELKGEAN